MYRTRPYYYLSYWEQAATGLPNCQLFSYTGAVQTWTVPAGVTSISIDITTVHRAALPAPQGRLALQQAAVAAVCRLLLAVTAGGY